MASFRSKPLGWRYESSRHSLAAKGIATRYNYAKGRSRTALVKQGLEAGLSGEKLQEYVASQIGHDTPPKVSGTMAAQIKKLKLRGLEYKKDSKGRQVVDSNGDPVLQSIKRGGMPVLRQLKATEAELHKAEQELSGITVAKEDVKRVEAIKQKALDERGALLLLQQQGSPIPDGALEDVDLRLKRADALLQDKKDLVASEKERLPELEAEVGRLKDEVKRITGTSTGHSPKMRPQLLKGKGPETATEEELSKPLSVSPPSMSAIEGMTVFGVDEKAVLREAAAARQSKANAATLLKEQERQKRTLDKVQDIRQRFNDDIASGKIERGDKEATAYVQMQVDAELAKLKSSGKGLEFASGAGRMVPGRGSGAPKLSKAGRVEREERKEQKRILKELSRGGETQLDIAPGTLIDYRMTALQLGDKTKSSHNQYGTGNAKGKKTVVKGSTLFSPVPVGTTPRGKALEEMKHTEQRSGGRSPVGSEINKMTEPVIKVAPFTETQSASITRMFGAKRRAWLDNRW